MRQISFYFQLCFYCHFISERNTFYKYSGIWHIYSFVYSHINHYTIYNCLFIYLKESNRLPPRNKKYIYIYFWIKPQLNVNMKICSKTFQINFHAKNIYWLSFFRYSSDRFVCWGRCLVQSANKANSIGTYAGWTPFGQSKCKRKTWPFLKMELANLHWLSKLIGRYLLSEAFYWVYVCFCFRSYLGFFFQNFVRRNKSLSCH